jgi:hypothetical protein
MTEACQTVQSEARVLETVRPLPFDPSLPPRTLAGPERAGSRLSRAIRLPRPVLNRGKRSYALGRQTAVSQARTLLSDPITGPVSMLTYRSAGSAGGTSSFGHPIRRFATPSSVIDYLDWVRIDPTFTSEDRDVGGSVRFYPLSLSRPISTSGDAPVLAVPVAATAIGGRSI